MTTYRRKGARLFPLVLIALALSLGCAEEDSLVGGRPRKKATPVPSPATVAPAASPTPYTGTDVISGVDSAPVDSDVETLPPNVQPTPAPTPLGTLGDRTFVPGGPRALAFLRGAIAPWILRGSDIVPLDGYGQLGTPYAGGLANPTLVTADGATGLWVVSPGIRQVARISTSGFEGPTLEATYSIDPNATGLAVDATEAWLVHDGGTLVRISKSSGAVATYAPSGLSALTAVALSSGHAWVTGSSDRLHKLDRSNGSALASYAVGGTPVAVTVDSNATVWTAGKTGQSLSRLPSGATEATTIPLGGAPIALAADSGRLWVALSSPKQLKHFTLGGTLEGTVDLPFTPSGLAIDAEGKVWLTDPDANSVLHAWGR